MNAVSPLVMKSKILEIIGISDGNLRAKIARGEFPRPIQISPRRVGWLESDVTAWFAEQAAKRTASPIVASKK
ncbi:MAG: AlpA family phage regulatory protein [Magnetococcales bacterium]|nr:AlpA family phage regulatory protein [Magnetococcales bacterium]